LNGYVGKTLWADLSAGSLKEETLDEAACRKYSGRQVVARRAMKLLR
jgi:hypothetical protein